MSMLAIYDHFPFVAYVAVFECSDMIGCLDLRIWVNSRRVKAGEMASEVERIWEVEASQSA